MVAAPRQFDICVNRGSNRDRAPFLVVLQHAVANVLETRLAAPMIPADRRKRLIEKIEPTIEVDGIPHVAVVSQLRALPVSDFGDVRATATHESQALVNALDFLVTGY